MSQQFAPPADPSGGIDLQSHLNQLMLITVHAHERGIQTSFGEKEAIRADVVVLGNNGEALCEYTDTLIFPRVLIGQLKQNVGGRVLGRLGQGQAKPGQKPPWMLLAPTEEDGRKATAYLNRINTPQPPF